MRLLLISAILLFSFHLFGQGITSVKNIKSEYESFEYSKVIKLSEQLLLQRDSLKKEDILDVLLMKAVSHYALSEEDKVRKCFIDLLKTERTYQIDSEKISPKIVKIFADVRDDYLQSVPEQIGKEPMKDISKDIPLKINYTEILNQYKEEKESVVRSFVFPGWGHIYSGRYLKGAVLASATVLNTAALIYFIIDSNRKEKDYINERNQLLINSKYSSYNKSYITRNILISSLILIYSYTQIDILFINPPSIPNLNFDINSKENSVSFGLKYSF